MDSQLSLARLAERRDDYRRARQIYEKVLKKAPDNAVAHHRLGVILAQQGRVKESLVALQAAQRLSPSDEVLADIGYAHLLDGNPSGAIAALEESLKIEPQNKRALNNLALAKGQQGEYAESLQLFRRATDAARAHANLAYVMTQNGDLDKAVDVYHRALDLDSNLKLAAQALVQLEGRRFQTHRNGNSSPDLDSGSQNQLASYMPDLESESIQPIPSEQRVDQASRPLDVATAHLPIDFAARADLSTSCTPPEIVEPQTPLAVPRHAAPTAATDDLDADCGHALVQEGPYASVPSPGRSTSSNTGPEDDFRDREPRSW